MKTARRQHQQLRRLGDPEHVDRGQQREAEQGDQQQVVREGREDAAEARRAGGQADRDRQHVVDEQRGGGEQGGNRPRFSFATA